MNCFNHPDKPAVGLCKSCCKGLCSDCAAALANGLACRNACENRVQLINQIIDSNETIIATANARMRSSGVFILILGACFCLFGVLPLIMSGNTNTLFMAAMGLPFVIYGILQLSKKRLYPTAK